MDAHRSPPSRHYALPYRSIEQDDLLGTLLAFFPCRHCAAAPPGWALWRRTSFVRGLSNEKDQWDHKTSVVPSVRCAGKDLS
jgi:hypothetical protein